MLLGFPLLVRSSNSVFSSASGGRGRVCAPAVLLTGEGIFSYRYTAHGLTTEVSTACMASGEISKGNITVKMGLPLLKAMSWIRLAPF